MYEDSKRQGELECECVWRGADNESLSVSVWG